MVVASAEEDETLHAMRNRALRVHVERLLHEQLRGVALALSEMAERELGERRRVAGLSYEDLARLLYCTLVLTGIT